MNAQYRHSFHRLVGGIILVFEPRRCYKIPRGTPLSGPANMWSGKIWEIAAYLENGTREARGYYGSLTGSHR